MSGYAALEVAARAIALEWYPFCITAKK